MKGYFFLFILSTSFVLINLYATPVHAVKGVALVIGNEDYKNKDYQVGLNNAYKMATALREADFYVMPVVLNAGMAKMKKAIKNFEKKLEKKLNDSDQETVGLFYYSGYVANYDEKTHLFPVGVDPDSKPDEDTTITLVSGVIEKMKTEPRILILDAFKSSNNDNPLKSVSTSKAETFIAYAISYTQYGQERSVYTKALIRSMKEKKSIEIEALIKKVNQDTNEKGEQIVGYQSSLTIPFSFVKISCPPICNEKIQIKKKYPIQKVNSVAWSQQGRYALSAGRDDGIRLWQMKKSNNKEKYLIEKDKFKLTDNDFSIVKSISFSPDRENVVSGKYLIEKYKFKLTDNDFSIVKSISFSPDRENVVSGHDNGKVHLWNVNLEENNSEQVLQYKKNSSPVASVSFSPDGKKVLAGSQDGRIWLWNKKNNSNRVTQKLKEKIFSVAFSEDGKKIIIGSKDGVYLWDWKNNKPPSSLNKEFCNSKTYSVKFFSKDKDDFLVVGCGNQVKIGKINNKGIVVEVHSLLPEFSNKAYSVDVSKDGSFVLSGSWDNTVQLWKLEKKSYKPLPLPTIKKKGKFRSVSFSPDGRHILLGGDDGMFLWEMVCN